MNPRKGDLYVIGAIIVAVSLVFAMPAVRRWARADLAYAVQTSGHQGRLSFELGKRKLVVMLHMTRIKKIYRTDLVETHALSDLTLHVKAGEFVAVMGPSGSGKTTFLNIAGLLDNFNEGQYSLDGQDVSRLSDGEMSRIRNEKIGFIFQSFNLIPDLDVFDNVDVPLRYRRLPASERKDRITRALEQVGLSSRTHHLPSQLSGGQQQRVAIARVLAGDPKLILADEPTGNLDSLMTREILDLLERANERGTTIVMVTHGAECAVRAHRLVHILDGRAVEVERAPSLVKGQDLRLAAAVG
ncbi:ABC transporter ATP-binding protein [Pendulispora brunnea]|uniref:ABC transporter ATP-binding protein n=1 Tax=Pendulispora brunnea TaxID=2905690 RepID=A0ABZ2KIA8_9BACT